MRFQAIALLSEVLSVLLRFELIGIFSHLAKQDIFVRLSFCHSSVLGTVVQATLLGLSYKASAIEA